MPTIAEIASLLDVPPPANRRDAERQITGVTSLGDAREGDLSFISSDSFLKHLATTSATAVIAKRNVHLPDKLNPLILKVDDADTALAKVLELFALPPPGVPCGVDSAARIAASATLGDDSCVGPGAFVGERARVGARTVLHPGVYVGDDTTIGEDCTIFPNVVLRERLIIGNRVTIHAGSVLGSDGFGYRWDGSRHKKVPQIGTVIVEDDVEIGSCVCIDRAKLSATRIGHGSKIDNLVQIGHNAVMGPHCIMVGQSGMAGSATLGTGVVLGGQTVVRDHTTVGDGAMAAACSGIAEDVPPKAIVSGTPAQPHRQNLREQAAVRRLPELVLQVRRLSERLALLEAKDSEART